MRKVDKEYGKDWWFKVWGPDKLAARGHRQQRRLGAQGGRQVARLRRPGRGLQPARPDQEHHHHAGAGRVGQVRQDRHPGVHRHQVPGRARRGGREDRPVLVLHHVHHRHHQGPLEHAADRAAAVQGRLRPQPAAVAHPAGVLRQASALRAHGPARPVPEHPRDVRQGRHRAPDHRDVPVRPAAGHEAQRRLRAHRAPQDRARGDRRTSKGASPPRCSRPIRRAFRC